MEKKKGLKGFFSKLFSSKSGRMFFIVGCLVLSALCVLGAWAIQGKDIGKILTSDLFIFWYIVIGLALFTAITLKGIDNEKFKK